MSSGSYCANKTHCPQMHPYSGGNLLVSGGKRYCKICRKSSNQKAREKIKIIDPTRFSRYRKAWIQADKDRAIKYWNTMRQRRRALHTLAEGSFTRKEWEEKLTQFNYGCAVCGDTKFISIDHIIPLSKGGSNYIENIQPLCISHNSSKGNKLNWNQAKMNGQS